MLTDVYNSLPVFVRHVRDRGVQIDFGIDTSIRVVKSVVIPGERSPCGATHPADHDGQFLSHSPRFYEVTSSQCVGQGSFDG